MFEHHIKAYKSAFVNRSKEEDDKTPILDAMEDQGLNIVDFQKCMEKYSEFILWMFDAHNIQKQRSKEFPKWSPPLAFYEAQATPTDVFKKIYAEFDKKLRTTQESIANKQIQKKYGKK